MNINSEGNTEFNGDIKVPKNVQDKYEENSSLNEEEFITLIISNGEGIYSWIDGDNKTHILTVTANETGVHEIFGEGDYDAQSFMSGYQIVGGMNVDEDGNFCAIDKNGNKVAIQGSGNISTNNEIYSYLTKQTIKTRDQWSKKIIINCVNLNPNQNYKIYLYYCSRHNGHGYGGFYHPDNWNISNGKGRMGYSTLVGKLLPSSWIAPRWMPHDGYLVTEWELKPGETNLEINPSRWGLDLAKPTGFSEEYYTNFCEPPFGALTPCGFVGTRNECRSTLLFKFCIVDSTNKVYPCINTLKLGAGTFRNPQMLLNNSEELNNYYISIV